MCSRAFLFDIWSRRFVAPSLQTFGLSVVFSFFVASISSYFSIAINGFDYSIFDWMLENQSRLGHMYSPIYRVNHLGIHASWYFFLLWPWHALFQSNIFLAIIGPLFLALAMVPLFLLCRRGSLTHQETFIVLFGYAGCSFVQILLKEGFRIESVLPVLFFTFLYLWDLPSLLGRLIAALALLSVKEDVAIYLIAFACYEGFFGKRWQDALWLGFLAIVFFSFNQFWAKPHFLGNALEPEYLRFWSHYGDSLTSILLGMFTSPREVFSNILTSGWWKLYLPLFGLPFLSPRHVAFSLPGIFILGTAASYPAMHGYGHYYPLMNFCIALAAMVAIVPYLVHPKVKLLWIYALVTMPLFHAGAIKWRMPNITLYKDLKQTRQFLEQNNQDQVVVCTQTAVFPYLGYKLKLEPLDAFCQNKPKHLVLIVPSQNPYPTTHENLFSLIQQNKIKAQFGDVIVLEPSKGMTL